MESFKSFITVVNSFDFFIILGGVFMLFAFKDKIINYVVDKVMHKVDKKLDTMETTLFAELEVIKNEIETNKKYLIKNRILLNIFTSPKNKEVIETDYSEYKALGGNSYIDHVVDDWREDND